MGTLASVTPAFAAGASFPSAAVGAERIAVAFYGNALGVGSAFGTPSDLAKGRLLNFAHREYFQAAMSQEHVHLSTLQSLLGASFPISVFSFPAGCPVNPAWVISSRGPLVLVEHRIRDGEGARHWPPMN